MKAILREQPLFSELKEAQLQYLADIGVVRAYGKKQYIFMEGDEREATFFIQTGTVKIFKVDENGDEQIINLFQSGEMFPHIGFFDKMPYPATAEVVENAEIFVLRIDDFNCLLLAQPEMTLKLMQIMEQKIQMLQQRVQELTSQDILHRVIRALLRLAQESGEYSGENEVYIQMSMTNQDMANMVGSTRETINRVLNQLKKENLLEKNRHSVRIVDMDALKNYQ